MARRLTVRRAEVPAENEAAYLDLMAMLAERLANRGHQVWVFRSIRLPHTFLEFHESTAPGAIEEWVLGHEELDLIHRLEQLATHDADKWDFWEEVKLAGS